MAGNVLLAELLVQAWMRHRSDKTLKPNPIDVKLKYSFRREPPAGDQTLLEHKELFLRIHLFETAEGYSCSVINT